MDLVIYKKVSAQGTKVYIKWLPNNIWQPPKHTETDKKYNKWTGQF